MRSDIRRILFHTSELVDIEERIIYAYPFLCKQNGRSVFYEYDQGNDHKHWECNKKKK